MSSTNSVKISFDINKGWNTDGNDDNVKVYPVNTNAPSVLIKPSDNLAKELLKMS